MNRKPEKDLPVMPSAKPELPRGHVQCAADPNCRYSGRMWIEGLEQKQRLCVNHYYIALDKIRNAINR